MTTAVFDPFTPDAADASLLHEDYRPRVGCAPGLRVFYRLKPAIPYGLQMAARRQLARNLSHRAFPAWPIEPALIQRRVRAFGAELQAQGLERLAVVNPWPGDHRFAVSLTHDVEGPRGIRRIADLLEIERRHGFVSSFNFVAEWYSLPRSVREDVRDAGCEIGLHGITHDGALFADRQRFEASLPKIRHYLEAWDAVGFRSPSTLRHARWMHELPVLYDSSFPDTDPFQPQPGGCCWIFPFFFGDVVELPMTLDQDHTLFVLRRERSIDGWARKSLWIIANQGLINVNVHPDYLDDATTRRYEELLAFLACQPGGWHALPREIAGWWRERNQIINRLTAGERGLGRATVVHAHIEGGAIVCER